MRYDSGLERYGEMCCAVLHSTVCTSYIWVPVYTIQCRERGRVEKLNFISQVGKLPISSESHKGVESGSPALRVRLVKG